MLDIESPGLWRALLKTQFLLLGSFFLMPLKAFSHHSCPMDGGIVILEESTPTRIEIFHYKRSPEQLCVDLL